MSIKNWFRALALATAPALLLGHAIADAGVLPPATDFTLPNGTVVQLVEKHEVPEVVLDATLRGGSLSDPVGEEGAYALLADWLRKGAGGRDAHAYAETVESVGGEIDSRATLESMRMSARFLSEDASLMVELVADALQRPRFDTGEFTRLRQRSIDEIRAARDGGPSGLLRLYARAWLMPGQVWGRPVGGDETSLAALTPEAVKALWQQQLGGDRLILTVVGDFKTAQMKAVLTRQFGHWRHAAAAMPTPPAPQAAPGARVLLVDKPGATQTYFAMGGIGTSRLDPDRGIQDLANTQFGGRFTSLLNTALRIKSGLSYGASSSLSRSGEAGPVLMSSFTATPNTGKALDLALQTLSDFRKAGIDADVLDSVRQYNLGSYPFELETASDVAGVYADLALYRLPASDVDHYLDQLRNATLEQVNAVIPRLYPEVSQLSMVLIGDAGEIRDIAARYGTVTEMSISAPSFTPPVATGGH